MMPLITQSCPCLRPSEEGGLEGLDEETKFGHGTANSNVKAITAVEKEALTNVWQK